MAAQKPQTTFDPIARAAAAEAREREAFFSFGDEGLTASVSTYGRLLRITQHFSGQKTGFCVDPGDMPEPYYTTDRMAWFLFLAQERDRYDDLQGIGPGLDSLCPHAEAGPQHEIINDRWPTFSQSSEDFKLRVGYVASGGTIYQKFEFSYIDGYSEGEKPRVDVALAAFSLQPDFLIRDLDFVEKKEFNGAKALENHTTRFTHNSITRKHKTEDRNIVLHIHVLSKDSSIEFFVPDEPTGVDAYGESTDPDNERSFGIRRRPENSVSISEDHRNTHVLKFALAYTLEDLSTPCSSLPTWKSFCKADSLLQPRKDEKISLSGDKKVNSNEDPVLDFFLNRNLEYILSVCSIPLPGTIEQGEVPPIALTCGDIEGHRVTTAASFYAFQFLLLALDRFMLLHSHANVCYCGEDSLSSSTTSYVCMMKCRIERVCKGHINWVFQRTHSSSGISCPNYWASGEEIQGWESNEWLPKRSLVDASFQLIKAGDLRRRLKIPGDDLDAAHQAFKTWMDDLKAIDKLDFSAFPSYNKRPARVQTKSFYFTDHALIWQAIKSAESMGFEPRLNNNEKEKYSANTLRKNILKRFTTENPVLKKRMIATKRTPTRTRFLLRSKDTFLFRAMDDGLFDKVDLWNNTMDCQQYHEGNDDTKWEDPRRFALSIAMARHNKSINLRSEKEMLQHAISILLRSSSANGLFAGKLDVSLSPVMYGNERERDDYWAVVFEVPYLLWKFHSSGLTKDEHVDNSIPGSDSIHVRLDSICHSVDNITRLLGDVVVQQAHSVGQKPRNGYWMKYDLPFNNMITEENIVELQDEWLYNSPSFFFDPIKVPQRAKDEKKSIPYTGFVVDVPEHESWKKEEPTTGLDLRCFPLPTRVTEIMEKGRTMKEAKKRLWAFVSKEPRGNAKCVDTVFNDVREEVEIMRFFRGHKSGHSFFTEQTEPLLNMWTTEFHMSFSHLTVDSDENPVQTVAMGFRFEGDFFDRYWTCRYVEADPQWRGASDDKSLLEMVKLLGPEDLNKDQIHEDNREDLAEKRLKVGPWRQRRVLELMLFGRIMQQMNKCAKKAFKSAEGVLDYEKQQLRRRLEQLDKQRQKTTWVPSRATLNAGEKDSAQGVPIDYGSFLVTSRKLQDIQSRLQAAGAEFLDNRTRISLWLSREEDRRAERPRWTFNDESRYGTILSKLLVTNNRSIQNLERNYSKIAGLSESITKELELVRSNLEIMLNDKEQRRAQDITLFTYVTAIFLPLGFATGLYSMSGAPDVATVGAMFGTFFGVLLVVVLTFSAVTKRVRFGKRPGFLSSTTPSSPSLKASTGMGSTGEEDNTLSGKNACTPANPMGILRPYSTTDISSSLIRRRNSRDLEAGESTVISGNPVAESARNASVT